MIVNKVNKVSKITKWEVIKFQLVTYCFMHNLTITDSDLECATLLGYLNGQDLTNFCNLASLEKKIFKSPQTVRNCVSKMEKLNLILRDSTNKRKIILNPVLDIQNQGNILLDYKFIYIGTEEV